MLRQRSFYIASFSFTVRAVFATFYNWSGGDSPDYLALADSIANGGFMLDGVPSTFRPPLYPLFIYLTGDVLIAQCVLGALTSVLVYRISRSVAAAVLLSLAPQTLYYSAAIYN
jgi:hypothetical protein